MTGLDVVVRRCPFVLQVNASRSADRLVELLFTAQTPNDAEPVSRQRQRHPAFVSPLELLQNLQHLQLRPR